MLGASSPGMYVSENGISRCQSARAGPGRADWSGICPDPLAPPDLVSSALARSTRTRRLDAPWSPSPRIDVVVVHRRQSRRCLTDAILIAYLPEHLRRQPGFYNPALVAASRDLAIRILPPALALVVPGHIWAGDYRYAELAALVIGAALIGFARPTLTAKLSASLLLTSPRGLFVLEQGWTEPIAVLLFAGTVYCLLRRPAVAPWVGGLMLVTKQYLVLAGVALLRFAATLGVRRRRFLLGLSGAALVATLPFVLWDPRAFLDNVVLLQAREPFRIDSISYLSWAARADGEWDRCLVTCRSVRSLANRAVANAIRHGLAHPLPVVVVMSRRLKAFCNYYFSWSRRVARGREGKREDTAVMEDRKIDSSGRSTIARGCAPRPKVGEERDERDRP